MTPAQLHKLDRESSDYRDTMTTGMGRTERHRAMDGYVTRLRLAGECKSIETMAALLAEEQDQTKAVRQRLQRCVSGSTWDDAQMRCRRAQKLARELPGLEVLLIDDSGFAKKGMHSVGIARQYYRTHRAELLGGRVGQCQRVASRRQTLATSRGATPDGPPSHALRATGAGGMDRARVGQADRDS